MKNWKVLVTGSSGFVGRYMVDELEHQGAEVFTCDVKDGGDMLAVLPQIEDRFDLVVHLAYKTGGRRVINGSPMNLAANTALDALLFQWAVETKQKRVLYFSSAAAYPISFQQGGSGDIALSEEMIEYGSAGEPDSNYGWAKLTGERMAYAAIASGLRAFIVRPFSIYGDGQSTEYPFPAFAKAIKNWNARVDVWGDAEQVRDFIHVTDVVKGALEVVRQDVDSPVNLCTGIGTPLTKLIGMMSREVDHYPIVRVLKDMPMGVRHQVGDPKLFESIYQSRVGLSWFVRRAMRWTAPVARPKP